MNILIFDLQLSRYDMHSPNSARPTSEGMIVSGYHISRGDNVELTDKYIDWNTFDKVYICGDQIGLTYDSTWFDDEKKVIPLGPTFGSLSKYDATWEEYPPYAEHYKRWYINIYKDTRFNRSEYSKWFMLPPFKVNRNGVLAAPKGSVCIIDNDIHLWADDCTWIASWDISNDTVFLHPPNIAGKEREFYEAILLLDLGQVWQPLMELDAEYYAIPENLERLQSVMADFYIPNKVAIGTTISGITEDDFVYSISLALQLIQNTHKYYRPPTVMNWSPTPPKIARLVTDVESWSKIIVRDKTVGSFLDWWLLHRADETKVADFLSDSMGYIQRSKSGHRKFKDLMAILILYPELIPAVTLCNKQYLDTMPWKRGDAIAYEQLIKGKYPNLYRENE